MQPFKMAMTRKSDLLFVYGTLMSAYKGENSLRLRDHAELLGQASCNGRLYMVSWYPGFVPERGGPTVWGELYRLPKPSHKIFSLLDNYEGISNPATLEGDEYVRKLVDVVWGGTTVQAWMYVYTGPAGQQIPGGRFPGGRFFNPDAIVGNK